MIFEISETGIELDSSHKTFLLLSMRNIGNLIEMNEIFNVNRLLLILEYKI